MSLRHEIYKLKYGEDGAKARMTEEARQDAIGNAELQRESRKQNLNELEAAYAANRAATLEQQAKAKNEAGRYTLDDAAKFIADNSKSACETILEKLKKSALGDELTVYAPGSEEVYKPKSSIEWRNPLNVVNGWYEEAYWDDLNKWLKKNEPRLTFEFPDPNAQTAPAAKVEAVTVTPIDGDDWKVKARAIADECFDHDTNATPSVRDSLATKNAQGHITGGYASRVMVLMHERGIKGARGIITNPATIMREALQGKKWWANKNK